jgi:transcription elongation GreA/GreB family factor
MYAHMNKRIKKRRRRRETGKPKPRDMHIAFNSNISLAGHGGTSVARWYILATWEAEAGGLRV